LTKSLRILFLSANPEGTAKLKLIEEYKQIDAKIQASEFRDQFHLEQSHAVSLMELQTLLLRFKPNIVHFSGHGSETGALVFENYDGSPEEAPPKALSNLFKIINASTLADGLQANRIKCVLLSACYSLGQAKAIAQYVDCVVGISDAIKDSSATNFATSFYQGLAFGRSMQTAFDLGCNQLGLSDDPNEKILKLEHRPDVDPSKTFLVSHGDSAPTISTTASLDPKSARSKNLSEHCAELLRKANMESDYKQLLLIDPSPSYPPDAPPLYIFGQGILQHLYTGHRALYDIIMKARDLDNNQDALLNLQFKEIYRLMRPKLDELGVPNDVPPHGVAFYEPFIFLMASSVANGRQAPKCLFVPGRDSSNFGSVKWNHGDRRPLVASADIGKKFCSVLNDLPNYAAHQLTEFYNVKQHVNKTWNDFNNAVEEFFPGFESETIPAAGACKRCLSLKYHDEEEIRKLRSALSELERGDPE
jgi:CHAT domain-containing protein